METITIEFVREKETKNTIKFQEVAQPGKPSYVGALYIQKWYVGSATSVTVQITPKNLVQS